MSQQPQSPDDTNEDPNSPDSGPWQMSLGPKDGPDGGDDSGFTPAGTRDETFPPAPSAPPTSGYTPPPATTGTLASIGVSGPTTGSYDPQTGAFGPATTPLPSPPPDYTPLPGEGTGPNFTPVSGPTTDPFMGGPPPTPSGPILGPTTDPNMGGPLQVVRGDPTDPFMGGVPQWQQAGNQQPQMRRRQLLQRLQSGATP
jgi:hypothetical protein